MGEDSNETPYYEQQIEERTEERVKEPELYRVILHNDHYTTMEFVVEVLVRVFQKSIIESTQIMLDVHRKGKRAVGTFTYDIAATKVTQVRVMARERQFPLKCTMEKA